MFRRDGKSRSGLTLFELGLFAVIAVGLGLIVMHRMKIARQTAIVGPLKEKGARVVKYDNGTPRILDLSQLSVDQIRMDELVMLSGLRVLNVNHSEITDDDIDWLSRELDLTGLHIVGTAASDKAAASIARFTDLRALDARGTFITDAGVASLAGLKSLTWMRLAQTWITDESLSTLAALPNLNYLDLRHSDVTDAGLQKLVGHPSLTQLLVSESAVTEDGVATFQAAMPDVRIEFEQRTYNGASIEDEQHTERLNSRVHMKRYFPRDLTYEDRINLVERGIRDEVRKLGGRASVVDGFIRFVTVENEKIGDAFIQNLSRLRTLERLNFKGNRISARAFDEIHRNRFLTQVTLHDMRVTREMTEQFSRLRYLLDLSFRKVDEDALAGLTSGPRLYRIMLGDRNLTDRHLAGLKTERFPRLRDIGIESKRVTPEGIRRLLGESRNLRVIWLNSQFRSNPKDLKRLDAFKAAFAAE